MLALVVVLVLPATAHATFPGQNGKIVFGGNGIHTINPDGTGLTEVIAVNGLAQQPMWSADGNRIAFSSNHGDPGCAPVSCNYDIFVVDADGSDLLRLTTDPGRDSNPMWSPDGTEIRFLSNRATNPDIFRVDSTGGNEALAANTGHQEQQIVWSPDGQTMAFSAIPVN